MTPLLKISRSFLNCKVNLEEKETASAETVPIEMRRSLPNAGEFLGENERN